MTEPNDAVARIADGFWTGVRTEADTPGEMLEAVTLVLAQALSLVCPACRKQFVSYLRKRLPAILAEAERIAAEPPQAESVQ